jgi:DNA-binding NtrC family response regulator
VVESELFGHEKGAFTGATDRRIGRFELADGGTLFLDEIGELSKDIQVKLLRVLQERQIERVGSNQPVDIDVRLIAATNQNLEELVKKGTFREDLFYRIHVIALHLPRLSERREDIPFLVNHFIQYFNRQMGGTIDGIDPEALQALVAYAWPGNIRELRNVIERGFVLETTDRITLESLPFNLLRAFENQDFNVTSWGDEPTEGGDFGKAKHHFEKSFILEALRRHKGNVSSTAQDIGLPRKTLYRKMELLQIDLEELHQANEVTEKQQILDCLKKHGGNISAVSSELGIPRTSVYRKLTSYGVDAKEFS